MISAYNRDKAKPITVTPTVDVTNEYIYAKVYDLETNEYVGLVNATNPYLILPYFNLLLVGSQAGTFIINFLLKYKYVYQETFSSKLISQSCNFVENNGNFESVATIYYEPFEYDEFDVEVSTEGVYIETKTQEEGTLAIDNVVVGGSANVPFAVPCNFTKIEPGIYSIIFEASETGVIGKDILIIYASGGYNVEHSNA